MELKQVKFDYSKFDKEKHIVSRTRIYLEPKFTIKELNLSNIPIRFVFDTGAPGITLPAYLIGITNEEEFIKTHKIIKSEHRGIVSTRKVIYYKYYIDTLSIGEIEIRHFPVEITFDKDVDIALLGMAFIGLFEVGINPITGVVSLTETLELSRYTHNNLPLSNPLEICKNEFIDLLDQQSLEANYINNLSKQPKD